MTPLPRAYAGDPFVIRTIDVGPGWTGCTSTGTASLENRLTRTRRQARSRAARHAALRRLGTLHGDPGGRRRGRGQARRRLPVHERHRPTLPPGRVGHPPRAAAPGGRPAAAARHDPGRRAPRRAGADRRSPAGGRERRRPVPGGRPRAHVRHQRGGRAGGGGEGASWPSCRHRGRRRGAAGPGPSRSSLHVAAGECVTVVFTNRRKSGRRTPRPRLVPRRASWRGRRVGRRQRRLTTRSRRSRPAVAEYRYYMRVREIGSAPIADFGGQGHRPRGLYGAIVVAPQGASSPTRSRAAETTWAPRSTSRAGRPEATATSPHPLRRRRRRHRRQQHALPGGGRGPALINYRGAPRVDDAAAFSSRAHGDPATPCSRRTPATRSGCTRSSRPGSEQGHVFTLGGTPGRPDPNTRTERRHAPRASAPGRASTPSRGRGRRLGAPRGDLFSATCGGRSWRPVCGA